MRTSQQNTSIPSPLSIRIDETLRKRLESAAKAEDRSVSYMAQKAIEDFVSSREHTHMIIMEAYNSALTEKEFISGKKMTAWVESWGTTNEMTEPTPDISRS